MVRTYIVGVDEESAYILVLSLGPKGCLLCRSSNVDAFLMFLLIQALEGLKNNLELFVVVFPPSSGCLTAKNQEGALRLVCFLSSIKLKLGYNSMIITLHRARAPAKYRCCRHKRLTRWPSDRPLVVLVNTRHFKLDMYIYIYTLDLL